MKTSRIKYFLAVLVIDIFISLEALAVPAIEFFIERMWELEKIPSDFWKLLAICFGLFVFFQVLIIGSCYKYIGNTIIDKQKIVYTSPLGEKWCEVSMDKPVYYAFCYHSFNASRKSFKLIAISNEPFALPTQENASFFLEVSFRKKQEFHLSYDKNKVIVFDYDERTKPLLPIDSWTKVGEEAKKHL